MLLTCPASYVEWDQGDEPCQIPDGLEVCVAPAAWLYFGPDEVDLGVVRPTRDALYVPPVQNVGSHDLNVTDIIASHDDTTADPTAFALIPGDVQPVTITICTDDIPAPGSPVSLISFPTGIPTGMMC